MALSCRCRQWSWRLIAHWDLPWCGHFLVVFQIWSAAARVIMSSPSDDSELRKYAPKWAREQPATSERLRSVSTSTSPATSERLRSVSTSTSIAPWSEDEHRDRRIMPLRPEPVPETPAWWADGLLALIGRLVTVAAFAAVIIVGHVRETAFATCRGARTRFTANASRQTIGSAYRKRGAGNSGARPNQRGL